MSEFLFNMILSGGVDFWLPLETVAETTSTEKRRMKGRMTTTWRDTALRGS